MSGAPGHLSHVWENRDLTFGELKDIIRSAAQGKLENVVEKIDAMNIVFTWNGELRVARGATDIRSGGMDAATLAKKFAGRGNVEEAFNSAFTVLEQGISSLPDEVASRTFGDGHTWFSAEVVYAKNPNVINYDRDAIVFHKWPVFNVDNDGRITKRETSPETELLVSNIEKMQKAITLRSWKLVAPVVLNMQALSDGSVVNTALSRLSSLQNNAGVGDDNIINDFLRKLVAEDVSDLGLSREVSAMVVSRVMEDDDAPTLTQIKKLLTDDDEVKNVRELINANLPRQHTSSIEAIIQDVASAVLQCLKSTLVSNSDEEARRIKRATEAAITAVKKRGSTEDLRTLEHQLKKLDKDKISAIEGVVFTWKGKCYKMTGQFAAVNRILGIMRYT